MSTPDVLLVLPSRLSSIAELEGFVQRIIRANQLSRDLQGNLLISLTEAVTNAIRHGNKLDDGKCVSIEVFQRPDELRVTVADEGQGFVPADLPDPTVEAHRAQEGGRGVFLMRALSDEIYFRNDGTMVEMRYECSCKPPVGKRDTAPKTRRKVAARA